MSTQLSHSETEFKTKTFPVILLLDNITGEANIGSMFRLADAFGVEKILFTGTLPNLNSNRLKRTARNTQNTVEFGFQENGEEFIKQLKKDAYKTVAIEITSESRSIQNFSLEADSKLLLIAGNERHGISDEILNCADEVYHIEMFGKNSSMNVAQSVGIALYEITKAYSQLEKK
ncbi:TrmH family RNA methyltransferase [Christiangramia aquimixticola]|uniref:TrmH family RNA methyltransferase n=1 Tax=Christiangramia aquimixticola TaxID=1697558 RepID=UPI003AA8F200